MIFFSFRNISRSLSFWTTPLPPPPNEKKRGRIDLSSKMPMKNDLVEHSAPFGPYHIAILADSSLTKFEVDRREAELWAVRDCKFLILDDTPDTKREYDSDDPDDMLDYALQLSLEGDGKQKTLGRESVPRKRSESDNSDDIKPSTSSIKKGKQAATTDWSQSETAEESLLSFFGNVDPHYGPPSQDPSSESSDFQCSICSRCPEFPHNRRTRNFRLFRPRDELPELFDGGLPRQGDICPHYVAVSYCWPPRQTDSQGNMIEVPRNYKVRDLDGTIRPNRALDDVLDRAVDVANTFGLRMIWIDQECLPQPPQDAYSPEKEDKELGIQAMDIIYNRAFVTAGLQDVQLSDQTQLDTILNLASDANEGDRPGALSGHHELGLIVDFLDKVSRDRWYTRAWVIQEAISAGDNLSLAFRRGPGLSCPSKLRTARHRRGLPKHSLESEQRDLPSEVVCIMVHEFRHIVQAAKLFLQQTAVSCVDGRRVIDIVPRPDEKVVRAAELLHPVFWKPKHPNFKFAAFGINSFGIRPTTDAAGALTLLNSRQCSYDEDRIAIMANMCGYEIRLNVKAIAEFYDSLRVALLALSLLNGDMSLLVPEAYSDTQVRDDLDDPGLKLLQGLRPGWVHPFDIDSDALHQVTIRGFNLPRTQARDKPLAAVRIPAYLWEVSDQPIDMTPIKSRWERKWARMMSLKTAVYHIQGEDEEAFRRRKNAIHKHVEQGGLIERIKRELSVNGSIRNDSPMWEGIKRYAGTFSFSLVLFADRVETVPELQKAFVDIFFGILRFLKGQADQDPRAQGVANSIWQSTRADVVPGYPELPDIVNEELFHHPAVVETPFRTLILDRDRQGGYNQFWLIDRIMRHGNLYAGCYVPENTPATGAASASKVWWSLDSLEPRPDGEAPEGGQSSGEGYWEKLAEEFKVKKAMGSVLDRQWHRLMSIYMHAANDFVEFVDLKSSEEGQVGSSGPDSKSRPVPGSVVGFTGRIARELAGETEAYRVREYTAAFDVDGPCTIAIPFDAAWEMIPHPSLRSMSVCWVVELFRLPANYAEKIVGTAGGVPSPERSIQSGQDQGPSAFIRVSDKVRAVWPIMDIPPWSSYICW